MNICDTRLSLDSQALAVLHLLADREADFAFVFEYDSGKYTYFSETFAWYNGRENGFSLRIRKNRDAALSVVAPHLHIVCANCRNSDEIVVYSWTALLGVNPPVPGDLPEGAWKNQKIFNSFRVDLAAEWIEEKIQQWHKSP